MTAGVTFDAPEQVAEAILKPSAFLDGSLAVSEEGSGEALRRGSPDFLQQGNRRDRVLGRSLPSRSEVQGQETSAVWFAE